MKIAVLGRGYLGKEFERQGFEVLGKDKFSLSCDYEDGIPRTTMWSDQWNTLKQYDIIINCIGKSNTRWCEDPKNFYKALTINGHLPKYLSEWCKINNKKFVHISTGCLYDKPLQSENDFLVSHCKYTVTKWIGECGCNKDRDLILRPRLYFSDIQDRNNLLCKLPKFSSFISDKKDSLASTKLIVEATVALLKYNQVGIFNVAHEGTASIFEVSKWCNIKGTYIQSEIVRQREGLYLVNCTMNIDKLKQFYQPQDLEFAIKQCYNILNETSNL
jgi:dTDP-4-dehydrorhamnose reductase